jgi:tetraacyldisaccharide 4'-kinase
LLDILYSGVARWRRLAAQRHPERRRRLASPVISVGNLSVGGTGKTPVVAAIAEWLLARGERPAVLSRGYKRRDPVPGVVVVSDGTTVRAGLDRSGDEPLMLAHALPGAIVCVAGDRYLAGALAERSLGATVHVLDDGFQHFGLWRDLDILVTMPGEIPRGRVLPRGRLREPAAAAGQAHILVVMGATSQAADAEAAVVGVAEACGASRQVGSPQRVHGPDGREELTRGARVVLAAAIANPERFAEDVRAQEWTIADSLWFPDHHVFTERDVARIAARAGETAAEAVFTTAKDAVRFEAFGALPFPLFRVPLGIAFDPPGRLFDRLTRALLAARGAA